MREFHICFATKEWGASDKVLDSMEDDQHKILHLREVSPDYDKAVQGLVEALKAADNLYADDKQRTVILRNALAEYEKWKKWHT